MSYTPEQLGRLLYEQAGGEAGQLSSCKQCPLWETCKHLFGSMPCVAFANVLEQANQAVQDNEALLGGLGE